MKRKREPRVLHLSQPVRSYIEISSEEEDDDTPAESEHGVAPRHPINTRRARPRRSYVDARSEDEDNDTSSEHEHAVAPHHSINTRSARSRRSYVDARLGDEDNDTSSEHGHATPPDHSIKVRRAQLTRSYVEIGSEDEDDSTLPGSEYGDAHPQSSNVRRKQAIVSKTTVTGRQRQSIVRQSSPHSYHPKVQNVTKYISSTQQKRIPPWQTLPYQILLDIFTQASYSYTGTSSKASRQGSWLLGTALVCKTFAEPALTVLYTAPSLPTLSKARAFIDIIQKGNKNTFNYNNKVRRLIATGSFISGRASSVLISLIRQTPLLSCLELVNTSHGPFDMYQGIIAQWSYPQDLILAMEETEIRLRHWRLSVQYGYRGPKPTDLEMILTSAPFQSLQTLELGYLEFLDEEYEQEMRGFAATIQGLKHIRRLSLELCILSVSSFLAILPPALERLELTRCPTLTAETLHDYLVVGGRSLTELVLKHNQSLDLSFLLDLEACCPNLQVLMVDMPLHDSQRSQTNINSDFDRLLAPQEIPTWPASLQSIELLQLQKRDQDAAECLFQSILNSATKMINLRKLSLYVVLSIPFRERAKFRTEWIRRMKSVFLRHSDLPNPHLMSIDLWKAQHASHDMPLRDGPVLEVPTQEQDHMPANNIPLTRSRRRNGAPLAKDKSETSRIDDGDDERRKHPSFQGLCNIVDIRIDNSKQREEKFTEEDFLDEEPSGDDDWDESRDGIEENEYAW